jgi:hypothetical protein
MTQSSRFPKPDHCVLNHKAFGALGNISFRKSPTDGAPVVMVPLGEREAAVPIRALQRELCIEDDTPDGRMLALIADALEFTSCLTIGDPLPREVLDGTASWEPDPDHLKLAKARLQRQLLVWLRPNESTEMLAPEVLLTLDEDPDLRNQVQTAFAEAARTLGLPGQNAVIEGIEVLAMELSYIEAMRDRLLGPVRDIVQRVTRMRPARASTDATRGEMQQQVERLATIALRQIDTRIQHVDDHTGDVISSLRHAERQCSFIRENRDWLYQCARAWEDILLDWSRASPEMDERAWQLLARTYHFLAPRYMPTHEWENLLRRRNQANKAPVGMTW